MTPRALTDRQLVEHMANAKLDDPVPPDEWGGVVGVYERLVAIGAVRERDPDEPYDPEALFAECRQWLAEHPA